METRPTIRTYKLRRSRITRAQSAALTDFSERFIVSPEVAFTTDWHPSDSPLILEIGFGMGEATHQLASAQPQTAVVAFDLHTPGVGNLISRLAEDKLDNVRVCEADGLAAIREVVLPGSLDGIRCFFPDPWPKAKHHKRRLLTASNLRLLATRVKPGGFLHFATDWLEYAEFVQEALLEVPEWRLCEVGQEPTLAQPKDRPLTKFEQRGIDAGRVITDIVLIRVND